MTSKTSKMPLLLAVVLLGVVACKKDPVEPGPLVPQQPNPLPANALIKQIKWSESDHYTLSYNADHTVKQLHAQWQYVEGDPGNIHSIDYDFEYDAGQRLVQVRQTGGGTTKYFYKGNLIAKTQEFYPEATLANETRYVYANQRIVEERFSVYNIPGEAPKEYKRRLQYDVRGNLIRVETLEQLVDGDFQLIQFNDYSDFDDRVNPTNWLLRRPFLPQVRWQFNNPGKEVVKIIGQAPRTVLYHYEYNEQELPISNTQIGQGGVLTGVFFY